MHVDSDAHVYDPDAEPSAELAEALGVVVVPELLELALTHRSFAFERGGLPHNERLEFLGDSILGQAVTVMLYLEHPDLDEGQLAKRRAALVSTVALAEIARGIGLGRYLHLGRGEHLTGGPDKDSILADTLEAIIGATYLSSGIDASTDLVRRLVEPLRDQADRFGAAMDPKTALQEIAFTLGGSAPEYAVDGTGPEHDRRFRAVVTVPRAPTKRQRRAGLERGTDALAIGNGEGSSKKVAEMAAALDAWTQLSAHVTVTAEAGLEHGGATAASEGSSSTDATGSTAATGSTDATGSTEARRTRGDA